MSINGRKILETKTLKIGWIGSGFVAQLGHLVHHQNIPSSEIVALAELRPKLGEKVCQRYKIPRLYNNHTALLQDTEIEVRRYGCYRGVEFYIADKPFLLILDAI